MTEQQLTWSLPIGWTHEVCASAAVLSFVGGAGDFDHRGQIRHPDDYSAQIKGSIENIGSALAQENCSLTDVIRIKAFVELSEEFGETEVETILLHALPNSPTFL